MDKVNSSSFVAFWVALGLCRIGELREVMTSFGRKQCDYDPVQGEAYKFDRYHFPPGVCVYVCACFISLCVLWLSKIGSLAEIHTQKYCSFEEVITKIKVSFHKTPGVG